VDTYLVGGIVLPQCIQCDKCNYVLYTGAEIKSPEEISRQYERICPRCGKELSVIPIKVKVKPKQ
jgi:hypothetical protein